MIDMKNKLAIHWFIEQHSDWEKLLSEKPYCLIISRDEMFGKKLIMFKYNMIDSDLSLKLVQECRGLILDEDTLEPISVPFFKFFNVSETLAAPIDWQTAKTATKIDGSLVKIVRLGTKLLISTNGTIDAFKAPIAEQINCPYKSFGDLAISVLQKKAIAACDFEEGWTYMFELVSPFSKIVIPYKETDMYYLGRRNNETFQEEHFSVDPFHGIFKIPEVYPLKTINDCVDAASKMPWDNEGYVVCDANFNRIKVKSPAYLAVHRLRGEGVMSYARAIELVRMNEVDEVLAYFPEFKDALLECKSRFWKLVEDEQNAWNEYEKIDSSLTTRKDKALWITKHAKIPGLFFGILDKKIESVESFFMNVPTEKILKYMGYKGN